MKRLNGFSLMEMMIVLTIVAIVAAASAPMVNKKMVRASSEKTPWIIVNGSESIAYNMDNSDSIQDRKTASIGARVAPNNGHPRLYINTSGDANPHIMFGCNNENLMRLIAGGSDMNTWLSNRVPNNATASVALGWNSDASSNRSVAVGMDTEANSTGTVAIGNRARARADVAIAIGDGAEAGFQDGNDANKYSAIAIGSESVANRTRSIAIGRHAEATAVRAIAVGSSSDDSSNNRARSMGDGSVAIGASALAANATSVALGETAQTRGNGCISIGQNARTGDNTVDSVMTVNADREDNKIAIGTDSFARRENSIAIGHGAIANPNAKLPVWELDKKRAIAMGWEARASDSDAIVIGNRFAGKRATASGVGAVAIGTPAQATGSFSIAIGGSANTLAAATGSTDVNTTIASANNAVAIGTEAQATAVNAVAIGSGAIASNIASVAIGFGAQATSPNTIVLGNANSTVFIPGRLVVDKTAVLGSDGGADKSTTTTTIIRSRRSGKMEILQRDGDRDYDALYTDNRVNWSWVKDIKSDRRLKNVGKEFKSGLAELKKLEVFNYTFKDDKDKTPRVGVMAQDLQKIFPNAVRKGEDGFLRIRMEDIFYAIVNAVKELDSRVSLLEQKQKKIDELEKRLAALEKAQK